MRKTAQRVLLRLKLFVGSKLSPISVDLSRIRPQSIQKSSEYLHWLNDNLTDYAEEFFVKRGLNNSGFVNKMSHIFNTARFEIFIKKWTVEYFFALLNIFYDYTSGSSNSELVLEDNPLNRFAAAKFNLRFGSLPAIAWRAPANVFQKLIFIFLLLLYIIFVSIKSGLRLSGGKREFKVMREALWGLYGTGGYYFHDDFLLRHGMLKKDDLLFFSRVSINWCDGRLKACRDAQQSDYAHIYLPSLPMGIGHFLSRIVPKYILGGCYALSKGFFSLNFSLTLDLYRYFIFYGLAYEKIFSNFKVHAELGHNYFSPNHVVEGIICQNHGTRYYLMHWSDISAGMNKYINSYLGCDKYLLWGEAHIRGGEGKQDIFIFTGYIFKAFIQEVMRKRAKIFPEMGIIPKGKIVTFFDESFGNACLMEAQHYLNFWKTAVKVALRESGETIIIKPKELARYKNLPEDRQNEFLKILGELKKLPNVYILDASKWSFIEAVGISDLVITQGMTSSATIAIICGVEGLYLDEANCQHPFAALFKDKLVFNDPEKLINMVHRILEGKESPLKDIPDELLRRYDEFPDARGLPLFIDILKGSGDPSGLKARNSLPEAGIFPASISAERIKNKVGIIIQARMTSTRLPGKVMRLIEGKPLLEHIFDRLKHCRMADEIILATTVNGSDDVLVDLAKANNIKFFRGSEKDVLSRYYLTAKSNSLDVVVRITSDCPLIDPEITDGVIGFYFKNQPLDYASNTLKLTLPRGLDVEVFSFQVLKRAHQQAKLDYEREHVTPHIYLNPQKFKIANFQLDDKNYSQYRWTVDTMEDFELISTIYQRLSKKESNFSFRDILGLFDQEPDLAKINGHIKQKTLK